MGVAQRVSFFVSDRFEELVDPDRGVDSKSLTIEGLEFGRACGGCYNGPKAGDTHAERGLLGPSYFICCSSCIGKGGSG